MGANQAVPTTKEEFDELYKKYMKDREMFVKRFNDDTNEWKDLKLKVFNVEKTSNECKDRLNKMDSLIEEHKNDDDDDDTVEKLKSIVNELSTQLADVKDTLQQYMEAMKEKNIERGNKIKALEEHISNVKHNDNDELQDRMKLLEQENKKLRMQYWTSDEPRNTINNNKTLQPLDKSLNSSFGAFPSNSDTSNRTAYDIKNAKKALGINK